MTWRRPANAERFRKLSRGNRRRSHKRKRNHGHSLLRDENLPLQKVAAATLAVDIRSPEVVAARLEAAVAVVAAVDSTAQADLR